jgi:hypothetical protein
MIIYRLNTGGIMRSLVTFLLTLLALPLLAQDKSIRQITDEYFQTHFFEVALMNDKPSGVSLDFLVASSASGSVEGKAGISIGAQPSSVNVVEDSTGMTIWNTIRSPLFIYRFGDEKWFPEWREHPIRTSIATLVYAGIGLALGGGGGGGSSDSEQTTTQNTQTSSSSRSEDTGSQTTTTTSSTTSPSPSPIPGPGGTGSDL